MKEKFSQVISLKKVKQIKFAIAVTNDDLDSLE